jgi:kumamolisin
VPGTHSFHAVQYLTPTDYRRSRPGLVEPTEWSFNPTPSVTSGYGTGRAAPDVSTDADPYSGYLLYEPSVRGPWASRSCRAAGAAPASWPRS